MKQRTLHLSFPRNDEDLINEVYRTSALNYVPVAQQARKWMRLGMKAEQKQKELSY